MEIFIVVVVFAVILWWIFLREKPVNGETEAPYKVEVPSTPVAESVETNAAESVVEQVQAVTSVEAVKKTRKPRVLKEQAKVKTAKAKKSAAIKSSTRTKKV